MVGTYGFGLFRDGELERRTSSDSAQKRTARRLVWRLGGGRAGNELAFSRENARVDLLMAFANGDYSLGDE